MGSGGVRPGAGRPRKEDKYAGAVAKAEKKIADRLPWLIDQEMSLAEGVWIEETTATGTRRVYKTAPDRQSIEYLINRIMGKPTDRQEVTGADGETLILNIFTQALNTAYDTSSDTTED